MLANCLFVELLLYWGFDCEQAEELDVRYAKPGC